MNVGSLRTMLDQERNALLAGLPPDEWDRLGPTLDWVEMIEQSVLHQRHGPMKHAYFPLDGYVSLLVELFDGFRTEIGEVGNEGMLGAPLVLGQTESMATAAVQVAGVALRVSASALAAQLPRLPTLHRRLLRFSAAFAARSAQLAACNIHHRLETRLVRCLLGLDDRRQGNGTLSITHEQLASLLCTHRPSISVAMTRLQRHGLIRSGTRSLAIADREGLERICCECYATMRDLRRPNGA